MRTVPLGEIVDFYSGGTPSKARADLWLGAVPWFSAKDVKRPVLDDSIDHLSELVFAETSLRRLPAGTIVIVVRGMILAHTVPISQLGVPATINQDLKALVPKVEVDARYLAAMLRAQHSHLLSLVSTAAHGTKKLETRVLQEVSIPLPPVSEQRRIAAILDRADAIRTKRRQVVGRLEAMSGATFAAMFGDVVREDRWPRPLVGDIATTQLGKMLDAKKQTGENARPYIRNANVQWMKIDLSHVSLMDFDGADRAKFQLQSGDILMCEGGQPGRCAIWRGELDDCYFQKAIHRIRLGDLVEPEYFVHAMRAIVESDGLKDFISTATIAHLTGEKLRRLPIAVPPIRMQREFARRVAAIAAVRSSAERGIAADDELFASLQSRAFRGEL